MKIKAVAFDVGGTLMPDYSDDISESVALGLRTIEKRGIYIILVSRFSQGYLREFARGAGINPAVISTRSDKWEALAEFLERMAIDPKETAAIGDSDVDITMLVGVGLGVIVGPEWKRKEIISALPKSKRRLLDMDIEDAIIYLLELTNTDG
jgi:hydroxymethylpyrimidine pyrophosphatase-like HAD family hydrolase